MAIHQEVNEIFSNEVLGELPKRKKSFIQVNNVEA